MKKNRVWKDFLFLIIAGILISYYFVLRSTISYSIILLLYPLAGAFFFLYGGLELYLGYSIFYRLPRLLRMLTRAIIIVGVSVLIAGEIAIFSKCNERDTSTNDYIVVLGSYVDESMLSATLFYRLDAAIDLYEKNPTMIVVSGGYTGARYSEAYYMEQYLLKQGVKAQDIIKEQESDNTYENLVYTKRLLDQFSDDDYKVTIVSSPYHMQRISYLAENIHLNASLYASEMDPISAPHFYLRECAALAKDIILHH